MTMVKAAEMALNQPMNEWMNQWINDLTNLSLNPLAVFGVLKENQKSLYISGGNFNSFIMYSDTSPKSRISMQISIDVSEWTGFNDFEKKLP